MLNVHFNLPFFDFISSFQTSNPSVRDSVNCILTCIRSKQNQKQKKKRIKKKRRNPPHTNTTQQCSSAISLESLGNHAVYSILMIILEYIILCSGFPMNTTFLPHWARQRSTMQDNNRERKMPSWIRICRCTAPPVFSTQYWVAAVRCGLRWPLLAHHPLSTCSQTRTGTFCKLRPFFSFSGVCSRASHVQHVTCFFFSSVLSLRICTKDDG